MFHKRLIKEFRENQKNIWGMVLTQWVMLIANVVLMLQTATFIAGMVRGENLQNQSIRLLVTLAVVGVVRSLMSLLNSKLSFEASKQVKARLRTMVYEKMMRLGSSYKEYFQTSEVCRSPRKVWNSWKFILENTCHSFSTACLHRSHYLSL